MSIALERECVCPNRYNYTMERLRQDCVNERNGAALLDYISDSDPSNVTSTLLGYISDSDPSNITSALSGYISDRGPSNVTSAL